MPSRPFIVGLVCVLMWIQAAAAIVAGIVIIVERNDPQVRIDTDLASSSLLWVGLLTILWAVLTALLAGWLWQGSNVVRFFVGLLMAFWIAGGVYALFAFDGHSRTQGVTQIIIALVVLWGIFGTDKARRFFAAGTA
ncbi:MAG: hypothetical protein MUE51_00560 [Thermoleophilia bacterium]|nr:hypothetical protein [Thermoleophilia bacterium]